MEIWDGYAHGEKPNGSKTKSVVKHKIYVNSAGNYVKIIATREAFNQLHHYVTYTDDISSATRFALEHVLDPKAYSNIGLKDLLSNLKSQIIQITTEIDIVVIE